MSKGAPKIAMSNLSASRGLLKQSAKGTFANVIRLAKELGKSAASSATPTGD